jgi:hypothetical protein
MHYSDLETYRYIGHLIAEALELELQAIHSDTEKAMKARRRKGRANRRKGQTGENRGRRAEDIT